MADAITTTSLKTLFGFPFRGRDWPSKFLIGAVLMFANSVVPIVPLIFVNGYYLRVMRQAVEGKESVLPAWDDWGGLATDGLRYMVVSLVYLLPGIVVLVGGLFLYIISTFGFPLLMAAADSGGRTSPGLAGLGVLLFFGSFVIMMLSMLIGSLLLVLGAIPLPVAMGHLVAKGKVASAFYVREWWPLLQANKMGYLVAWVVVVGLATVVYYALGLAYITVILCFFIPFLIAPIGFYLMLVSAALFGQTYRESADLFGGQVGNASAPAGLAPIAG
jgi:hypothetical protein